MDNPKLPACVYARVSTLLNQRPEHQLLPIRELANRRNFDVAWEYVDYGISGARERRPELDRLLRDARLGKFKIVIVAAIDRLGRNTRHLLNLIHELDELGIGLISLRENLDFTTSLGKATLSILGAVAELEANLTRERIRTALAVKKLEAQRSGSGWRCGRPVKASSDLIDEVLKLRVRGLSVREIEKVLDRRVSHTTIGRIIKSQRNKNLEISAQIESTIPTPYVEENVPLSA